MNRETESGGLEAAAFSLLFPRGATDRQRQAVAGPVAALTSAGATADFLKAYLGGDLAGAPWERLDRALTAWRRQEAARHEAAEARAEADRRAAEARAEARHRADGAPTPRPADFPAGALADGLWAALLAAGRPEDALIFAGGQIEEAPDGLAILLADAVLADSARGLFRNAPAIWRAVEGAAGGRPVRIGVRPRPVAAGRKAPAPTSAGPFEAPPDADPEADRLASALLEA